MTDMESDNRESAELTARVTSELEKAAASDDETRLKTLDELYRSLESELERDIDHQTGPPRY